MNNDKLQDFIRDHREAFDGETPPPGLWDRIEEATAEAGKEECDPLEAFVAKHRDAFDTATPPPRLLEEVLPAAGVRSIGGRRRFLGYLMAVAAALLLLVVGYTSGNRAGFRAAQDEQIAAQLETLDPGLAEAERFYRERIATEFVKVNQVNDDPQLREDLEAIDRATAEIREELLTVPASQRHVLVNQLIATYRTKLDILLRIQQHFPNPKASGTGQVPANTKENDI